MRWLLLSLRYTEPDEKDKRKELPRRESWMHTRWYALVFCGLFFIGGLITIFDVPVIYNSGPWKVNYLILVGIYSLLLGIPATILFVLLHAILVLDVVIRAVPLYLIPSMSDRMATVILLVMMTIIMFMLLRRLQRFRRLFKWAVYLSYLPHLWIILTLLLPRSESSDDAWLKHTTICDYSVSATTQIHVVDENPYPDGADAGFMVTPNLVIYSLTLDSGQTWRDFMLGTAQWTCNEAGQIAYAGKFNDRFFWLWQESMIAVTRDGGSTWRLTTVQRSVRQTYPCYIRQITFVDEQHGQLECYDSNNNNPVMTTEDGGRTWHEATP